MLAVTDADAAKPKFQKPVEPPPPKGTVWELVERERLALGMSASALSVAAMGAKSRSHYNLMATNGSWETAQGTTLQKYVAALVSAGVSPERLHAVAYGKSHEPAPVRVVETDMVIAAQQLARDIAADGKYPYDSAFARAVEVRQIDGAVDVLAWRRATLRALSAPPDGEREIDAAPTPVHSKEPEYRKGKRKR